jgi:hypothetical protein
MDTLKAKSFTPIARLEWLHPDGSVAFEIKNDLITDGSLNVNYQNGTRRTATISLDNWANTYDTHLNKIWHGQPLRLLQGLRLPSGADYLLSQGIFYINNPEQIFNPYERKAQLNLVDKWSYLDGSLFGKLDGIYQINVNDNLFTALKQLLLKDRGNGLSLDNVTPVLNSYYEGKTVTIVNASGTSTTIPVLNAPYTARIEADQSFADVILEIATMLVASVGYDHTGRFRLEPTQTDILDSTKPVLWNFKLTESEFLGSSTTALLTDVYNDIKVVGAMVNGLQASGRATNRNPVSDTCVQRIGLKTFPITNSKYYADQQCQEIADYELKKRTILQKSIAFRSSQMYHLQENQLITLLRPEISVMPIPYLINGFVLPIGAMGEMSINATSVNELN